MLKIRLTELLVLSIALAAATARGQTMNIDLNRPTTTRSPMQFFSIGSDRAKIFLRDEHQRDLKTLQAVAKFQYLRCHGIFNEEMHIVTRNADGSLSFD